MKKLFFAVFLIPIACYSQLSNRSSNTITSETNVRIAHSNPGDILSSVIVSSCSTVMGSKFIIYDSSGQASNLIATIHTSSSPFANASTGVGRNCEKQFDFFIRISSAITYTTTSGADVTILWKNDFAGNP